MSSAAGMPRRRSFRGDPAPVSPPRFHANPPGSPATMPRRGRGASRVAATARTPPRQPDSAQNPGPPRPCRSMCSMRLCCLCTVGWVVGIALATAIAAWLAPVRRVHPSPPGGTRCWPGGSAQSGVTGGGVGAGLFRRSDFRAVPPVAVMMPFRPATDIGGDARRANAAASWAATHPEAEVYVFGDDEAQRFAASHGLVRAALALYVVLAPHLIQGIRLRFVPTRLSLKASRQGRLAHRCSAPCLNLRWQSHHWPC